MFRHRADRSLTCATCFGKILLAAIQVRGYAVLGLRITPARAGLRLAVLRPIRQVLHRLIKLLQRAAEIARGKKTISFLKILEALRFPRLPTNLFLLRGQRRGFPLLRRDLSGNLRGGHRGRLLSRLFSRFFDNPFRDFFNYRLFDIDRLFNRRDGLDPSGGFSHRRGLLGRRCKQIRLLHGRFRRLLDDILHRLLDQLLNLFHRRRRGFLRHHLFHSGLFRQQDILSRGIESGLGNNSLFHFLHNSGFFRGDGFLGNDKLFHSGGFFDSNRFLNSGRNDGLGCRLHIDFGALRRRRSHIRLRGAFLNNRGGRRRNDHFRGGFVTYLVQQRLEVRETLRPSQSVYHAEDGCKHDRGFP
ncbi:MAG: hypothetical protein BWY59_01252 [Verrucomicrobia bacterium ADurb.Bin345]|nr:MAG: hypothetical protein BWY59_01252 [Verrucomicrobia bacterium ADurb.Bin345]